MKTLERSREFALALQADLPKRRLGPPASCLTRASFGHTLVDIPKLSSLRDRRLTPWRSTKQLPASRSALYSPRCRSPLTRPVKWTGKMGSVLFIIQFKAPSAVAALSYPNLRQQNV